MNNYEGYLAREAHIPKVEPKETLQATKKPTTDLEYREAALHAAIAHFEAKNQPRVLEYEIVKTAQHFEQYLRHG